MRAGVPLGTLVFGTPVASPAAPRQALAAAHTEHDAEMKSRFIRCGGMRKRPRPSAESREAKQGPACVGVPVRRINQHFVMKHHDNRIYGIYSSSNPDIESKIG